MHYNTHCNSDAALTESTTTDDLDSTTVVTTLTSAPAMNVPGPQRSNGHAATHVNTYPFILVTMYVYIIM